MRCESWARHLMGFVPETELQRSFDRAFADHESNFPVSAYEIKTAWQRIVESEQSVVRQDNLSAIDNPIDCVRCDGSGVEMIYNSTGECLGARPGCDHKPVSEGEGIALYLQHQAELIADTKAKVALDASFREAIRICSRLITELIQAEAETEDDSEREQIVAGKGQLLRVRRYLQASI